MKRRLSAMGIFGQTDAAKGNINKGKAETQAISDKEIMRMSKRDFNELQRQNWVGD